MILAPAGAPQWGGGAIIAALLIFAFWWLPIPPWVFWLLTSVTSVLWLALALFFRDPPRRVPCGLDRDDLLSPADGRISAIEHLDHHDAIGGPTVVIRIFLSVLDVHINRMPCDAQVVDSTYVPGKFLDARSAESARVNEYKIIRLTRTDGLQLAVRQVSGAIARRIVSPVQSGQAFSRGQRFGLIKFGSTTELILPADPNLQVHVAVGNRVTGGRTLLASMAWSLSATGK
ncbi:MAG: phosphatidylserine decarboxylase [Phycisphaerales bacterium]|nr:phosphatidylserine decarboxylase [Phycisphaerales bacterium]